MSGKLERSDKVLQFVRSPAPCLKLSGALLYWFQAFVVLTAWVFLFTKIFLATAEATFDHQADFLTKVSTLILFLPTFTAAAIGKVARMNHFVLGIIIVIAWFSWLELFLYWFFSGSRVLIFINSSLELKLSIIILCVFVVRFALLSLLRGWVLLWKDIYIIFDDYNQEITYCTEPDQLVEKCLPFAEIKRVSVRRQLGRKPLYWVVVEAPPKVRIYVGAYDEETEAQMIAEKINLYIMRKS